MATGSKVPFRGLKEGDGEEFEEEEAEEGFFQKVLTLPFSWFLSRRLWLGPQCSKLPLLSCCRQPPPAGPPGDGEGWLKSFQRSRRMCFTSKSFRPEPDMLDTRKEETLAGAAVYGPADGGGQRRAGLQKEVGCALCTLGSDAARRDARPARQRPERGRQSQAAQLRSGPRDPRVGSPLAGSGGRNGTPRAENPRSPLWGPVVTAGGMTLVLEMSEGRRAVRSEAREAAVARYTSLGCTRVTASVGKVSALLSLQLSSVPGKRRERKSPKSQRSAPPTPPAFSVHLRPCPWPLQGCSESLPDVSEKVKCLLQGEKGWFYTVSL